MRIDLHVHSTYSDGLLTPEKLLKLFRGNGYTLIAVTDHDNLSGSLETVNMAPEYEMNAIPAVEITSHHITQNIDILGYYCEPEPFFLDMLTEIREERILRAGKMIAALKEHWDFDIKMKRILELAGTRGALGRPHIARALVEQGHCSTMQEAFDRYIGDDRPAYIRKQAYSPAEVINAIKKCGGVAILAHPGKIGDDDIVREIINLGVQGLEVHYFYHSHSLRRKYAAMAKEYGLITTGGSDFHGRPEDYEAVKRHKVPVSCLHELESLRS